MQLVRMLGRRKKSPFKTREEEEDGMGEALSRNVLHAVALMHRWTLPQNISNWITKKRLKGRNDKKKNNRRK